MGVCADGVRLEGTIIMWLPEKRKLQFSLYPWRWSKGVTARVRQQTYDRLLELSNGTLSRILRHLLAYDPIAPVINELHFAAIDRRLGHVIEMIQDCIAKTVLIE
ncbi:hypothetical protein LSAT2_028553, partial [Lamellibrachia satsuma]